MSDQQEQSHEAASAGDVGGAEGDSDDQREQPANAEAIKYRRQLRAAETARDGLAERLEGLQRREVERFAGDFLESPGDLWLTGAALPELLDESGAVDPEKVATVARGALADRPHWRAGRITVDRDQGQRDSGTPANWSTILGR